MESFNMVPRTPKGGKTVDLSAYSVKEAEKALKYHESFDLYKKTPLTRLDNLAKELGVAQIRIKDESYRFGLNAFKVLGGSYAIGRHIAKLLGQDIENLPASRIMSKEVKEKLGEQTFVTATDGNHGRGVAWTANRLGQKSVVYMPKGSSLERLNNIKAEGAHAEILDMNYDDCVRHANQMAEKHGWIMVQDTAWEGYTDIPLWIIQGYMTMAMEIVQQLEAEGAERPTHIFLQAGVGSMSAAVTGFMASYYGENCPTIAVVEPNIAGCLYKTAKANDGKLHNVTGDMQTIMAGLACGEPCTVAWDVLDAVVSAFVACPEYSAADGMRVLAAPRGDDKKVISGESGALPAGFMYNILTDKGLESIKNHLKIDGQSRILLISTEGDTDEKMYRDIVWNGRFSRYYK